MKKDSALVILGSLLAYYFITSNKAEAADINMPGVTTYPSTIPMKASTEQTDITVDNALPTNNLYTLMMSVPIPDVNSIPAAISVPITTANTNQNLAINITTVPTPTLPREIQQNIEEPKSIVQDTSGIPAIKQNTYIIEGTIFYADYSIPLYSLVNRTVTNDVYNILTSMGFIGLDTIKNIQNIGKIDWSELETSDYFRIVFNALFTYIAGISPDTIGSAFEWVIDKWLGGPTFDEPDSLTPQILAQQTVDKLKNWGKQYSVSTKNGLFLGFMAKNRVNSSMVPIVRLHDPINMADMYATAELIPIFVGAGYQTTGDIAGYISRVPFENSCRIKLMYNILLTDFVLVQEGSEYERLLVLYDYIPITALGYVSVKLQNGQEDTYITGSEYYEKVKNTTELSTASLFTYGKGIELLSNSIVLLPDGDIRFPKVNVNKYKYNPFDRVTAYNPYSIDNTISFIINKEYYSGIQTPPSGDISSSYESVYNYSNDKTYMGIDVPPLGGVSDIVTENADSYYKYNNASVLVTKGTKRLLVRLIDGGIIEIILTLGQSDYQRLIYSLIDIASSSDPRVNGRIRLGYYLKYINNRPVYVIDDYEHIRFPFGRTATIYDSNSWYRYKS